jgi:hypothetical protein
MFYIAVAPYEGNKCVIGWRDGDNNSVGFVRILRWIPYMGIVLEDVTVGNNGKVQYLGVVGGFSGLIPGMEYCIDYSTQSVKIYGDKKIGQAISDTEILLAR